jgi:hypothetical protein
MTPAIAALDRTFRGFDRISSTEAMKRCSSAVEFTLVGQPRGRIVRTWSNSIDQEASDSAANLSERRARVCATSTLGPRNKLGRAVGTPANKLDQG